MRLPIIHSSGGLAPDAIGFLPAPLPMASYARRVAGRVTRSARTFRRRLIRLDTDDIVSALNQFGASVSDILMVHSSLSACGEIAGGPATVVGALLEWTAGKTLALPTHSYCYPDAGENQPAFQVDSTPSQVGAITEYFRQQPGVVRSIHPSHSLACMGPRAHQICGGHDRCGTPCGRGTPYERLVVEDASVLMFGAPMSSYTLYHTAEDAAGVPYAYHTHPFLLRIAQSTGELRVLSTKRHSQVPRRFVEIGDRMAEEGLVIRRHFGRGTLRLIPSASAVHQWLLAQLDRDPWLLADRALVSGLVDAKHPRHRRTSPPEVGKQG